MRRLEYPPAAREPDTEYTLHGRRFDEPYRWLEHVAAPDARAWIAAQEAVTRSILDAVPGRDRVRAAVARASRYARLSPPIRTASGREFVWQAGPDDERLALWMRRSATSPLEVVLDPNRWPAGEVLAFAAPSPDGAMVAFGVSVGGAGAAIRVLDLDRGVLLPDQPRGLVHESLAWRPDSRGFFYAAGADPGEVPAGEEARWHAVYEHRLGSTGRRLFAGDRANDTWCAVEVSECGRFAILTRWDFVHANAVYLLRLSDNALVPVAPTLRSINRVQVLDDALLIHTDLDAPRGRLCLASLAAPAAWRTLVAETDDTLQSATGVGGRLYLVYSRAASHRVQVHDLDGAYRRDVALPALGSVNRNEGEGIVSGISGSWRGDDVWVRFTSYVQPPSIYRYDDAADRLVPHHVPDVGLAPSDYTTQQVWYSSRDGTRVSMFLIHRADLPLDGHRPVRLSGYGGYNISVEPNFTAEGAAWLSLGGVLAFANVRGGGEYGRAWHEAARKTHRQNAFDDFIAAARWLVASGYTVPAKLAARGNSNGGLLVTVAAMQAPDAFGAAFSRVPTLDLLRHPSLRLGGSESELGSPSDPVEGAYLASYSPYHNVRSDRPYPPMLFISALDDRIAPPPDPLKMVARLQAEAPPGGPYLLLPLHASGHGGAASASARIDQLVDELCFYRWSLDIT